jgi:hypothetical protein
MLGPEFLRKAVIWPALLVCSQLLTTSSAAAGFELRLAANHWERAIETHAANFTEAEHLLADVNTHRYAYWLRRVTWHRETTVRRTR